MMLDRKKETKIPLKKEIKKIVRKFLKKEVFSASCIAYSRIDDDLRLGETYYFGYTNKFDLKTRVKKETYFDLASLTKPLVTVLSIASLIEEGRINLEDNLSDCCNWNVPEDKKKIKISQLLSHSSGLPAHRPYYQKLFDVPQDKKINKLKNWILRERLCFPPGTKNLYSDLGFLLIGFIIEEITGTPLDIYWKEKIATPLELQKGLFFSKNKQLDISICAATDNCLSSDKLTCGVVHDDNCRAMGGVGGHAGLFGTAPFLISFCEHLIKQYKGREEHPSYSSYLLRKLMRRFENSNWAYGFDSPTKNISSSGIFFDEGSRGHLGFTGTSFWIDFEREISIVVLTNRVHLSADLDGIKEFRPRIHNAIMRSLLQVTYK